MTSQSARAKNSQDIPINGGLLPFQSGHFRPLLAALVLKYEQHKIHFQPGHFRSLLAALVLKYEQHKNIFDGMLSK